MSDAAARDRKTNSSGGPWLSGQSPGRADDAAAKIDAEMLKEWAAGHGHDLLGSDSLKAIIAGLARALLAANEELDLFKSAKKAAIARAIGKQEMAESALTAAQREIAEAHETLDAYDVARGAGGHSVRYRVGLLADAQAERIATLEAALAPFAELSIEPFDPQGTAVDDMPLAITQFDDREMNDFTVGDVRRARAALASTGKGEGE